MVRPLPGGHGSPRIAPSALDLDLGLDPLGTRASTGRLEQGWETRLSETVTAFADAVSLTAALVRQYGTQRFADATLTNPARKSA